MIAKDFLLEFPLGGDELCNYRKEIDDLRYMYPYVNFEIMDNKYNWKPNRETVLDLNNRIEDMLSWIGNRREQHIAIVSHSSYLGQFKEDFFNVYNSKNIDFDIANFYKSFKRYEEAIKYYSILINIIQIIMDLLLYRQM